MKRIRADRTFIYYYLQMRDGTHAGLRFSRTHFAVVAGDGLDPENFSICGKELSLPLGGECPEALQNVRGQLVEEHPEIEDLLKSGREVFEKIVRNPS